MEDKPDVRQGLRRIRAGILTARTRLAKLAEKGVDGPTLGKIESACAQLERIAIEMHWAVEARLAFDLSKGDPRVLRQMEVAQRLLIDDAIETLGAVVAELRAGGELEKELVN